MLGAVKELRHNLDGRRISDIGEFVERCFPCPLLRACYAHFCGGEGTDAISHIEREQLGVGCSQFCDGLIQVLLHSEFRQSRLRPDANRFIRISRYVGGGFQRRNQICATLTACLLDRRNILVSDSLFERASPVCAANTLAGQA